MTASMDRADRTPNDVLRAWRMSQHLSQDDLARMLRDAGQATGRPNDASKRLVQRWESGTTRTVRPVYARALEAVAGLPVEALGFSTRVTPDGRGGHDLAANGGHGGNGNAEPADDPQAAPETAQSKTIPGNYTGVWLSEYEYYSSSRDASFTARHYVVLLHHGNRLTVRSLPQSADAPGSTLTMALEVDQNVVTGTWREETSPSGFYVGAVYHGAIQMLVEPTGRRIAGKWLGFGKGFDVNTGPWTLTFRDASTSQATLDTYSRPPDE
ncbi:helix-turn-helix domain-containing protein [Tenggerimyces flavus]|uniref:Helix-turn-helix domain-containing protein n=1 Tax=Tenggerimyces flavus TaxID=1708749 RepID=A0ABV7Y678_9ACTN|nr:helix-turn-helix transcriptional regulator [Tenggerimyces flavus]MBM7788684.1 transcriptional regulator with XRE-family HTH domain [Tenggerimyces flavus]